MMITLIRCALLRRRIREQQARLREANQCLEFYEAMKADAHRKQTDALNQLAHIQRGAVPEGYDIAPTFRGYAKLGIGQYVLHNCPRTDEDHPSLVIAIATEEEKAGRQVGELRQSQPGLMIQPERIAVRIDFKSVAALDALEQQLRFLREDSFPDSLVTPAPDHFRDAAEMVAVQPSCMTCGDHGMVGGLLPNGGGYESDPCPDCTAPAPAEVLMPKPVAYGFGNTAITGHTNRLMMVRIDIPGGDQYAGAFWLPLVLADEAHTYGIACRAAGEAAGYARGLRDAVRDADIDALRLYVRALCKAVDAATDFAGTVAGGASWWDDVWADHAAALDRARERISQAALRGEVKP